MALNQRKCNLLHFALRVPIPQIFKSFLLRQLLPRFIQGLTSLRLKTQWDIDLYCSSVFLSFVVRLRPWLVLVCHLSLLPNLLYVGRQQSQHHNITTAGEGDACDGGESNAKLSPGIGNPENQCPAPSTHTIKNLH